MLHLHFLIQRKEGLSRKEFSDYWRNTHAPLAMQIPGVRRYVQNHTLPVVSKNPPHDGIVELWMDNREAVKAAFNSPAYRQGAYIDEPNFANVKSAIRLQTEDHVMCEGSPVSKDEDLLKRVSFIKRKPDMSPEEFSQYWLEVHGPLAGIPVLSGCFRPALLHCLLPPPLTRTCPSPRAELGQTKTRKDRETGKNQGRRHHQPLRYEVLGCKSAGWCPALIAAHKVGQSRI